jgi:hypothetical protein
MLVQQEADRHSKYVSVYVSVLCAHLFHVPSSKAFRMGQDTCNAAAASQLLSYIKIRQSGSSTIVQSSIVS